VALTLDPVLGLALRGGLALLLGSAAWHKLRDLGAFRSALEGYRLLPEPLLGFAALALIAAEIVSAGALVRAPTGGYAAAALLALYSLAIGVNLARGRREIDCGCFGPAARQPLSLALVLRNLVLLALALACALPETPRPLVWVDALTIAAALGFGALVHGSVNALLANAPRLRALRDA
jgi:hypothetical protein